MSSALGVFGKSDGGKTTVERVHHVHRSSVHHQLHVRLDQPERVPRHQHGERDTDQRHRGPSGRRGVPGFFSNHQPADSRVQDPRDERVRHHVRRAEHTHRTIRVSTNLYK